MTSKASRPGAKTPGSKSARVVAPVIKSPASVPDPQTSPVADVAKVALPAIPVVEAVVEAEVDRAVLADQPTPTAAAPTTDTAPETADIASKGSKIMDTTMEKTQAMFADMNDRAKAAVEKNTQLASEFSELAKGNVEALVESGKIAAKGLEVIGQNAAEYSRTSFEQATATLKSMSAVKSPADFFKLQSDFVRSAFDGFVAESSKNTEAFIKLAGDAAQPVSNRVAVAMEKVKAAA